MHLVVGRRVRMLQRRREARDREEERGERRAPLGTGVAPAVVKPRRLFLRIQRDGGGDDEADDRHHAQRDELGVSRRLRLFFVFRRHGRAGGGSAEHDEEDDEDRQCERGAVGRLVRRQQRLLLVELLGVVGRRPRDRRARACRGKSGGR